MLQEEFTLESLVFEDELSRKAFEIILETLDYITPIFENRGVFDNRKWNILDETWEGNFWKQHNLYLPKDLNNKDLFSIFFLINEKFWILDNPTLWTDIKRFIWFVKLWLHSLGEEEINSLEEEIKNNILEIIKENNLELNSYEQYEEIINSENIFIFKSAIKEIKSYNKLQKKWWEKMKVKEIMEQDDDLLNLLYRQEFDLIFFKKWINMLRNWLMTFTKADLLLVKEKEKNLKWEEEINISIINEDFLDDTEQRLREKIKIDEYKQKLEKARNTRNKEEIINLEKEVSNLILKTLNSEYPYYLTEEKKWYQPNKILEYKQMFCVWFSLVWHSFLSELWIKHNTLSMPGHSALDVIIWWQEYYFDATIFSEIKRIEWGKEIEYKWKTLEYKNFTAASYENVGIAWEPEKILLSQIYNNKWISLDKWWKYKLAIKEYDKALGINPKNADFYNNKWILLGKIWWFKLRNLNILTSNLFKNWKDYFWDFDFSYREEKQQIRELFKEWDFSGIRKYLLSLE